jgi:hypothetical protein
MLLKRGSEICRFQRLRLGSAVPDVSLLAMGNVRMQAAKGHESSKTVKVGEILIVADFICTANERRT